MGGRSQEVRRIPVPDMLAMARLLAVPVIVWLTVTAGDDTGRLAAAAVLFLLAAATDFLDGYLARRWQAETVLGAFLDTTADKVLVTGTLIGLVAIGGVWVWAALAIIVREIVVMGLRGIVIAHGAFVKPSIWGKLKAVTQFIAITLALLPAGRAWGPLYADEWAMLVAVFFTLMSFWGYLVAFGGVLTRTRAGMST